MVPGGGLEPPHCYQRRILNPLRLPIPPSRQRSRMRTRPATEPRIMAQAGGLLQGGGYNRAPCRFLILISIYRMS